MIDLKTIKLVIWDLDETLWKGTLSEGSVVLPEENAQLVKDLTDCGIVNSISSKNDFEPTKKQLQDLGLWDLFVFPSINWDSKGPQLLDKIDKMALRPVNVLFLDDNPSNLGEARHFLPEIQTGGPESIGELIAQVKGMEKKDIQHKRLKQYQILEVKDNASRSYANSEDFLYDSHIQVAIHHDCLAQIQRIHELMMRSNQLNYTKKRIGIEELERIVENPNYDCGYVTVNDRFGDYGIVGFYAMSGRQLEHFFFSCRTMGQKIEQWVYAQLGFPELEVVGEVRTKLNKTECPEWINHDAGAHVEAQGSTAEVTTCNILMKGPCDLSHSQMYIKSGGLFDTEFTYVSNADGQIIDAYNHSVHIEGLYTYSEEDKRQIVDDCIFVDPDMLSGGFFTKGYDVIFLSTLIESRYCIYQKKGTQLRVAFGSRDLTNPEHWQGYCDGTLYTGGNKFTLDYLRDFSEKYEYIGNTTPERYVDFLEKCMRWLPEKSHLCLILGATKIYDGDEEARWSHQRLNEAIKAYSKDHARVCSVELDECIHDKSDFAGDINHFSTRVYYELAQQMIGVIQTVTGKEIKAYSSTMASFDNVVLKCRRRLKRWFKPEGRLYRMLKKVYNKVYKERK